MIKSRRNKRPTSVRHVAFIARQQSAVDRASARRLREAQATWRQLCHKRQLEVIRELIETRAAELKAAFPDVLGIAEGYRTKRRPRSPRYRRHAKLCVRFLVEKKWPRSSTRSDGGIPSDLWAYATRGRKRVLCAIPTDVAERSGIIAQDGCDRGLVRVTDANLPGRCTSGMIACVVQIGDGPTRLAVSCAHVFGLRHATNAFPKEADAAVRATGDVIARVVPKHGLLLAARAMSFDAALAELKLDAAAVSHGIRKLPSDRWLHSRSDLKDASPCTIHTQDGKRSCGFVAPWDAGELSIEYEFPGHLQTVSFASRVFEFLLTDDVTRPGDSGSPVTDSQDRFIGMHIGGKSNHSYVIPAFELFDAGYYVGLSSADRLGLRLDYS